MIDFNLINIIGVILSGLLIGFLSGVFGVGGGFLMTPILRIVFGIPYNIAVASDLTAIAITSFYGVFKHYKLQHVNIKLGLIILIGMLPGVEIGARILTLLKNTSNFLINGKEISQMDFVLNSSYIVVLFLAAFIMFIEYYKWAKENRISCDLTNYKISYYYFNKKDVCSLNIFALLLLGFFIGVLNGMLGVGGGFLIVPLLINIFSLPAVIVVGTSLFIICPSSVYGAISHIIKGNTDLLMIILILCGSILGTYLGSQLTEKIRGKKIRLYFVFIILLAIIMISINFVSQLGYLNFCME